MRVWRVWTALESVEDEVKEPRAVRVEELCSL